jgi:hypothetical protein
MISRLTSRGNRRHDRVLRLLDAERKVLTEGPLSALQPLVDQREALLADLLGSERRQPEGFLETLQAKAERNSRLLLACLTGLRTAQAQVEASDAAALSLKTYTASGAAVEVSRPAVTRDQRR